MPLAVGATEVRTLITEDERREAAIEEAGREGVCGLFAAGPRTGGINIPSSIHDQNSHSQDEGGGGESFCAALNAELLFNLGTIAGGLVDMTEIVSLLLCPGTPSNVFVFSSSVAARRTGDGEGVIRPSLNEAALVIRGAIVGGAVDATVIVSERL
jgi:hypothetical protein